MQNEKQRVDIPMTTLPIYMYQDGEDTVYEFDARECEPPEPMVNAMRVLQHLKHPNEKLKAIFFHEPAPLLAKISQNFNFEVETLQNGDTIVIFTPKA